MAVLPASFGPVFHISTMLLIVKLSPAIESHPGKKKPLTPMADRGFERKFLRPFYASRLSSKS